jgi:transposase-like protein
VEPFRKNRRWPEVVTARIEAENLQSGVSVVDAARHHVNRAEFAGG